MTDHIEHTTSKRYIDTADVAKLIRKHLKQIAPATKFSVRIDRYSGGSSVHIVWTDGPTEDHIRVRLGAFAGGRFESMTDCAYSADSWYCPHHGPSVAETYGSDVDSNNEVRFSRCCNDAELVHFSATHVSCGRRLSEEFTAELAAQVRKDCGMAPDGPLTELLPENSRWHYHCNSDVHEGVYRLSTTTSR